MNHFELLSSHSKEHGPLLENFISFNRYKTILEVGVAYGTTSLYLCNGCKKFDGTLYGFDIWDTHGLYKQFSALSSKENVIDYLNKNNVYNFIMHKVDTKSEEFDSLLNQIPHPIDFAFIDGDHSYSGLKNDFDKIYPLLFDYGTIVFHDTLRIDGCREFALDLRNNFNDGTFDIFELPWGNSKRRVGLTFLVKRSFARIGLEIDEICGSPSNKEQILKKEKIWFESQMRNKC